MKLYIVADMEGIAGVVSFDQISGAQTQEATLARQQYTEEVKAVCVGAIEAGVEEIYINDFHDNGRNLIIERLPPQAMVIRGGFRASSGFDLLDETFVGLVMLGAHARSGSAEGLLAHTYTDRLRFEIFGQPVGEFDLLSLVAGEQKVPTILISGDSKTIEQAGTNLPATHTVTTKYSLGSGSALCIHPIQVIDALKDEIKRAVKNAGNIEPPQITPPTQLLIRCFDPRIAERIEWIPGLKRRDEGTFEFIGDSMKEVARLVYGVTLLASGH
jgi:D-amino peptidase